MSEDKQIWDGFVKEIEFFDRALSATEIQTIFIAGSVKKWKNQRLRALQLKAIGEERSQPNE